MISGWVAAVFGYQLVSRLAYVFWVGAALRRVERSPQCPEADFPRFRRTASALMVNDAVSILLLCVVSWGTIDLSLALRLVGGLALSALGLGVKAWAAATLGGKAYYWYDFFAPEVVAAPNHNGPYRFFRNPMYTIGYVQLYGFALLAGSGPALIASLFDHVAILTFYHFIERPHFARLTRGTPAKARVTAS